MGITERLNVVVSGNEIPFDIDLTRVIRYTSPSKTNAAFAASMASYIEHDLKNRLAVDPQYKKLLKSAKKVRVSVWNRNAGIDDSNPFVYELDVYRRGTSEHRRVYSAELVGRSLSSGG